MKKGDFDDLVKSVRQAGKIRRKKMRPSRATTFKPADVRAIRDSLDNDVDEGVEAAWDAEIARRIREIDEGKVKLVPWAEVRRRLTRQ